MGDKKRDHKKSGKSDKDSKARKNTSLRLPADTLKDLKRLALEQDSSVQAIIEDLIDAYLRRQKGKSKA